MTRLTVAGMFLMVVMASPVGVGQAAARQTTASPEASPVPGPVVGSYAEVGPAYEAARDEVLVEGRAVVDLLLAGETETLHSRLSPEAQGLITAEALGSLIPDLESDRVHFEIPAVGGVFDGHLEGQAIEGYYVQSGIGSFRMERVEMAGSPTAVGSLDGRWEGTIFVGQEIEFVVDVVTTGGESTGTIDVPAQELSDLPLANISYQASVELGELVSERALPAAPMIGIYVAEYAWSDAALTIHLTLDGAGGIVGMQIAPHWPLPPDPAAGITTETTFRLPFEGVWWVYWGGETVIENYHAATTSQRHASDIVIWKDGGTYHGDGTTNEDYWAWGQPALAPADGTVVAIRDGIADNTPGELEPEVHPAGNHVVVQTAEEEFVFIAHLQQGSVRVAEGDDVTAGDAVGLTGNSGNSSEPHIHIHAQNRADFYAADAIGLPLRFSGYVADGEPVTEGMPVRGQFVAQE